MFKFAGSLLALALVGLPLYAQGADTTAATGLCAVPDTITVTGNSRVDDATVRATIGLVPKTALNYRDVQRAVKALYATGNYDDVHVVCSINPTTRKASLDVHVKERPVLAAVSIHGMDKVSKKDVDERLSLTIGTPVDPAKVALAVERVPELEFWIVGDGHERPALEGLTAELGMGEHVRFWGQQMNTAPFFSAADGFVMSSLSEGLPMALLQAMSLGTPAILTDVDGSGEVLRYTGGGLLVPVSDPAAFADAIVKLAQDDALRAEFSRRSLEAYERDFTLERMNAGYMELYSA